MAGIHHDLIQSHSEIAGHGIASFLNIVTFYRGNVLFNISDLSINVIDTRLIRSHTISKRSDIRCIFRNILLCSTHSCRKSRNLIIYVSEFSIKTSYFTIQCYLIYSIKIILRISHI